MIVFCFLPACVMILCNVCIISLYKKQRYQLESASSVGQDMSTIRMDVGQSVDCIAPINRSYRKAMERQMSLIMAVCVIVFLSTTLPVTICLILLEHIIIKNPDFAHNNEFYILIFRILRILMYTHCAINFYLYCLTSRMFRNEFLRTITCRRQQSTMYLGRWIDVAPNRVTKL